MRLHHLSMATLVAVVMTSPAMACSPPTTAEMGCGLSLTIVNVDDGFAIIPRERMAAAVPGPVAQSPLRFPSPPHRLGGAVWFDDELARLLITPLRLGEQRQ
ncbi:MAG: hypothetical protein KGJ57_08200 [Sphingomonadales bacterium]|nr:hypothetical protein [Sphingomonadales bacterium]MDE2169395.1 hypothetical protein [Sphingomonadales bacterium]